MPYWVDGNNVVGISASDSPGGRQARRALLEHIARLRASRGGKFVVYFDGDDFDRRKPPTGVQVRYAAPVSADAAILEQVRAAARPQEVTVVTNDRGLASESRALGAFAMTWGEFEDKSRTPAAPGRGRATAGRSVEEPVRIRDWQEYFGLTDVDLEE